MTSYIGHHSNARTQLNAFLHAKSDVRVSRGGVFGRLRERRLAPAGSIRTGEAWTALKTTLDKTHGRSGALAMRAVRDSMTRGEPLTRQRLKAVRSRADAYAAARNLLELKGTGRRRLRAADVEKAVNRLKAACAKAAAAAPQDKAALTPEAVLDSIIRDLPIEEINDLSLCERIARAADLTFNPDEAVRWSSGRGRAEQWSPGETAGGLVRFAGEELLRRKLETAKTVTIASRAEEIGSGAYGTAYKVAVDGREQVFKPLMTQEMAATGASEAESRFAAVTRFNAEGVRSAARAVASDRVAELLGFGELVRTRFAVREEGDKVEFGVTMEMAAGTSYESSRDYQRAIDNARPGLARLQMMDWICGQGDRHIGNVRIDPETGAVKAFDNDDAFTTDTEAGARMMNAIMAPPPVIDTVMRDRLHGLALNPNLLENRLKDILDEPGIRAARIRLDAMVKDVAEGRIMVIAPDAWPRDGNIAALQTRLARGHPSDRPPINGATSYPELYKWSARNFGSWPRKG